MCWSQVAQQRDQGALTRHVVQLQQLQDQDHVCKGFETALVEQILGTGRKTMTRSVKLLALNFRNKNMLQYCGLNRFNIYVICSLCSFSSAVELYLIVATMALWSSQWHTSPVCWEYLTLKRSSMILENRNWPRLLYAILFSVGETFT